MLTIPITTWLKWSLFEYPLFATLFNSHNFQSYNLVRSVSLRFIRLLPGQKLMVYRWKHEHLWLFLFPTTPPLEPQFSEWISLVQNQFLLLQEAFILLHPKGCDI